jgi:hypothetical protein
VLALAFFLTMNVFRLISSKIKTRRAAWGRRKPSRLAQEIDRTQFREILQVGHNRFFEKI